MDQVRTLEAGDDIILSVFEETTPSQPFGTGHKLVRDISVLRGNEKSQDSVVGSAAESDDRARHQHQ